MRSRALALATALGILTVSHPVQAVSNADYAAARGNTRWTRLAPPTNVSGQLPSLSGQVVELEGAVNGLFTWDNTPGFLLRLDSQQTVIVALPDRDPDVAMGATLRVLARVPWGGAMLQGISVTEPGLELAQEDLAAQGVVEPLPVEEQSGLRWHGATTPDADEVVYYHGPPKLHPPGESLASQPEAVQLYARRIKALGRRIEDELAGKIAYHILDKSERYGVDPRLTLAVVAQESRFNPRAVSRAGAQGLGQLMPGTAAALGVRDPFDVEQNIEGTVSYLRTQLQNFGRVSLALAAYNAGPASVRRSGGVPPIIETQNYVRAVWKNYCRFAGLDVQTGQPRKSSANSARQ